MKSYKEIQGWCDFEKLYEHYSNQLEDHHTFVEVGVWKGRSICFLGQLLKIKQKKPRVFAIDSFKGSTDEEKHIKEVEQLGGSLLPLFKENLKKLSLEDLIEPIEADSAEAANLFEDGSVSILFIDANHSYEGVLKDLEAWYPKISKGGLISGHDIQGEGVTKALTEFAGVTGKNKQVHLLEPSCWGIRIEK
tara:strand:- start:460 stop:1035 length:576 start_codon:yes stop_codon:yes gene_type:complete